jgi:hypothetical protein
VAFLSLDFHEGRSEREAWVGMGVGVGVWVGGLEREIGNVRHQTMHELVSSSPSASG